MYVYVYISTSYSLCTHSILRQFIILSTLFIMHVMQHVEVIVRLHAFFHLYLHIICFLSHRRRSRPRYGSDVSATGRSGLAYSAETFGVHLGIALQMMANFDIKVNV